MLLALEMASERPTTSVGEDVAFVLMLMASVLVGWMLAHRRPDNVIGWLLLANGFVLAQTGLNDTYLGSGLDDGATTFRVAASWSTHGWPLLFAPTVAIAFILPDGRLPSRRWRPAAVLGVASFAMTLIGGMASHETLDPPLQDVEPLALLPEGVALTMQFGGLLGMIATLVLAAASLVVRYRRAGLEERQQLKWIALAGTLLPVAIIASSIEGFFVEGSGWVTSLSFFLVMVAIPVAIGVAVTRYRLFDIDRVISATVAYAVITSPRRPGLHRPRCRPVPRRCRASGGSRTGGSRRRDDDDHGSGPHPSAAHRRRSHRARRLRLGRELRGNRPSGLFLVGSLTAMMDRCSPRASPSLRRCC